MAIGPMPISTLTAEALPTPSILPPLTQMLELYCSQYESLREENLDLQPMAFHKRYGLAIQTPHNWNVLSSVEYVIGNRRAWKAVIIFGSTESYRKIYEVLQDKVQYFSWHEIFTGIHTASTDVRYIQRAKQLLTEADLTFFLDPPSIPEVMDQVCGQTANCLIVLSGGVQC